MPTTLVVDDEPRILLLLKGLLSSNGYEVTTARDGLSALELVNQKKFDVILTDVRMPDMDGMELYENIKKLKIETPVVFLTAYGTVESAIEAIRNGAFDYISKPFKVDELLATMTRAVEHSDSVADQTQKIEKPVATAKCQFNRLIAESAAMAKVCDIIQRVSATSTTVLINGESGTGKEVIAKTIHEQSRRKDKPFVAVNCAALPEPLLESEMFGHVKGAFTGASSDKMGLFETADEGTLFLDEVSSMPLSLQGKLLRALQEREIRRVGDTKDIHVNTRVIAASNINLEKAVQEGKFRTDLFYRLAVIPIDIPPLRNRPEDIMPLTRHFIKQECEQNGFTAPTIPQETEDLLVSYPWPGNVRELENAMRHALTFIDGDVLTIDLFPPRLASYKSEPAVIKPVATQTAPTEIVAQHPENAAETKIAGDSLKNFLKKKEQEYLKNMLAANGGDKEALAKKLKISLSTLYRKLPELEPPKQ